MFVCVCVWMIELIDEYARSDGMCVWLENI